jgi:hypothetical protein
MEDSNSAGSSTTPSTPAECSHEPKAEPTLADCSYVPEAEPGGEKEFSNRGLADGCVGLKGQWREENLDLVPDGAELAGVERSGRRPPRAHQATSWVARHPPLFCYRRHDRHWTLSVASLRLCPSVGAPALAMAPPATPTAIGDVTDHASRDVGEAPAGSASANTLATDVLLAHLRRSNPAIGGRRGAALSCPQA